MDSANYFKPMFCKCFYNGSLTEAIQNLPPELREKIYNIWVKNKIKEKNEMGFDMINSEIKELPFCEENHQITKITFCRKCRTCEKNSWCYLCFKKGKKHFIGQYYDYMDDWDFIEFGIFNILKYI